MFDRQALQLLCDTSQEAQGERQGWHASPEPGSIET